MLADDSIKDQFWEFLCALENGKQLPLGEHEPMGFRTREPQPSAAVVFCVEELYKNGASYRPEFERLGETWERTIGWLSGIRYLLASTPQLVYLARSPEALTDLGNRVARRIMHCGGSSQLVHDILIPLVDNGLAKTGDDLVDDLDIVSGYVKSRKGNGGDLYPPIGKLIKGLGRPFLDDLKRLQTSSYS
jgi:hypothetical protein